jgi:tetratricopeptide (TPR) repeat protein
MGRHSDSGRERDIPKTTLGQRIRNARRALGLTQEALGRPDFTKGFISLLENDRAKPSVVSLERLAARLGRPVSHFLEGDEPLSSATQLSQLRSRGRVELARGSFAAALSTFEEMRRVASSLRDDTAGLQALLGAGEALLGLDRVDEAHAKLHETYDGAQQRRAPIVACRAAYCLATIEARAGRYGQAVALARSALDAAGGLGAGEFALRGEIQLLLGTALSQLGRLADAADAYRAARTMFEEAAEPDRAGKALYELGAMLSSEGNHAGALLQFERARSVLEQHEISRHLSRVSDEAGTLSMRMGESSDAVAHFTASLALKERLRDVPGQCRILTELAKCLHAAGDSERAHELAEQAAARSRDAALPEEEARAQALIGTLAAAAGDLREAQRALVSAARYCEDAGMTLELVPIYKELARIAGLAGRYKDASGYHERVFRLLQGMRPAEIAAAVHAADALAADVPGQRPSPQTAEP